MEPKYYLLHMNLWLQRVSNNETAPSINDPQKVAIKQMYNSYTKLITHSKYCSKY